MSDRTVLDLFRYDMDAPRRSHHVHWFPGGRRSYSTEDFLFHTSSLADALSELGVGAGDRVVLLSDNRPEWHMADLAILDLAAVDVPVYPTSTADQLFALVQDSGATVAVTDTGHQTAKLLEVREKCPALEHLIQIEGPSEHGVLAFSELAEGGDAVGSEARFWDRATACDPQSLMTLIYTSGTTGDPKGVMLSHDNVVQNVLHAAHRVPVRRDDQVLEFLPLCHIFERMVGYIYMWRATTKHYCSITHVADLIAEIQPTLFAAVPRFFEKVRHAVMLRVEKEPPHRRAMFRWALEVGRRAARRRIAGKHMDGALAAELRLAERLILSKVRQGLGGRVRYCVSGGAELDLDVAEFFHAVGLCLVEGYGLTETSPVIAVNGSEPGTLRLGTVGKPLDNVEIRLTRDGELLVRGPSVMQGYWNRPQETADAFTDDGFFRTGDIAELDDDGFLLIVDRKKDLLVTAGGKNIAPQAIEAVFERSPFIEQAVVVGDRRPYLVALFAPDENELRAWAGEHGITAAGMEDLIEQPAVVGLFEETVASLNQSFPAFEQIKKFRLLPFSLTQESGHLTPTLKIKRRVVEQQFQHLIGTMYGN